MVALQKRPDVKSWEVEGEAVVYDPISGQGHILNPTAMGIWHLCDGENTSADIERELTAIFPNQREAIRADVTTTVRQLTDLGLLATS